MTSRVIIEADGGSRGNPGPASYGALIRDADTGIVIAERGETIGVATNNVAEYNGLIAGLELFGAHTPDAQLEVRMDSKLVIEQMAGRWKIKHPSMRPLAERARQMAPAGTVWTWVPREQNAAADALANAALDSARDGGSGLITGPDPVAAPTPAATGWGAATGAATTLVLLRHGVTPATERKVFSGSGSSDPALTEAGMEQARRAAHWLQAHGGIEAIVASPMRRTRQTAAIVGETLGLPVEIEDGVVETNFGDWDGHTFAEIQERWGEELTAWLASSAVAPPGGEAFDVVYERVAAARDRLLQTHAGRTVLVVSHVTPIKMLVRRVLDAPMDVIHKMELSPASITTIQWWSDGPGSLRNFNVVP
ncbi:bifunctional RNase H/acid phosphatase [Aeromicrobium wangtongii]|uniref:bifunctional RNase H/acid phosphatase n=1 Tax=Aeromicrobium wangtongii TaxID=2969247 RepID=UPI002016D22A|nr:bifunctional RNase H/acid phosphatase [Aeromicrobium wangtongii]MCL3818349.1 bifunctional RNase H/acid phosphatase [Aeromicrobium wangtongii]